MENVFQKYTTLRLPSLTYYYYDDYYYYNYYNLLGHYRTLKGGPLKQAASVKRRLASRSNPPESTLHAGMRSFRR